MELQMNPVKAAFAARRPTFGLWSMLPHPLAVEGLAAMGLTGWSSIPSIRR